MNTLRPTARVLDVNHLGVRGSFLLLLFRLLGRGPSRHGAFLTALPCCGVPTARKRPRRPLMEWHLREGPDSGLEGQDTGRT